MSKTLWISLPLLAIVFLLASRWFSKFEPGQARGKLGNHEVSQQQSTPLPHHSKPPMREYVLEVIGLGVTVEKYRQGALWDILQKGPPHSNIRELDPKKYPWTSFDKHGLSGDRACDALENGAGPSPMFWGVPTFYAGAPWMNPADQPSAVQPASGLAGSAIGTGMAWHLFATGPWLLDERPDRLLERVFSFFDEHPDLPYIVLSSEDSPATRDLVLAPGAKPSVQHGHYIPSMPDSSAVFVLARRERVEPLRPFVWDDPDNEFLQEHLRAMYFDVHNSVPTPEKLADPTKVTIGRQPTVDEWLVAAAAFAKNPKFTRTPSSLLGEVKRWANSPSSNWKPTPWFPIPWNREQMATFDKLPTLGFIHRPTFVSFKSEDGEPISRRDQRLAALEAGWKESLQTLSEPVRESGPARIIAADRNQVEQRLALEGLLHRYAGQGGPEIDTGKSAQFIDTDRRLGNTGAATFFVQMALGVMGSYRDGGTTAVINLRDPNEASIVFISPPPEELRQKQKSFAEIFKSKVSPAIDPANYKAPAVESLLHD